MFSKSLKAYLLFCFLNLNSKNEINKIKIHPKQLPINPKTMVVKPSSPPHLPQLQYGYDDGFTTIVFGLIGSCLGCILILLISFFEFKFKNQNSKP